MTVRSDSDTPVLRIIRGAPDDHEIAATVAALLALAGSGTQLPDRPEVRAPGWTPAHGFRPPGAWTSA